MTSIEWTDTTWNPVVGCARVSPGCEHCYAETMARRLEAMGHWRYRGLTVKGANGSRWTGNINLVREVLNAPLRWRKPRRVFVDSMSDLFHDAVPEAYIREIFEVMRLAHWHRFQVLTKRAERLAVIASSLPWAPNVWMGVSVESERYLRRVEYLRTVPAAVRFLSLEPLLGPLPSLCLDRIGWVIVGGESGPRARPCEVGWIRDIVRQCRGAGVACFYKQGGASNRCQHNAKGGCFECFPDDLKVREFPNAP